MKSASSIKLLKQGLLLAAMVVLMLLVGCDDKPSDGGAIEGPESSPISVDGIIVNPKSPVPGDTVRVTAVVTSDSANEGDFVKYAWTASGGTFVEDDLTTVSWIAPTTSSVYVISVTATNSVSKSSLSKNLFVGELTVTVPSKAGEFIPLPAGDFYYLSSPFSTLQPNNFGPTQIRYNDGVDDVGINPAEGFQYEFNSNYTECVYTTIRPGFVLEIVTLDLEVGDRRTIAWDRRPSKPGNRSRAYTDPDITPDSKFACYGGLLVDAVTPAQGGLDTLSIFVQDLTSDEEKRVTFSADNVYPSFSNDGAHLVFISNRVRESSRWDLFQLPVTPTGVPPDTANGALVQLTLNTQDFIREVNPPEPLNAAWSPVGPPQVIAVVDRNDDLLLIPMDASGPVQVTLPGDVTDFVWSPSGTDIMAVSGTSIYRVDRAGGFTVVHEAIPGDRFDELSWSPNEAVLVYLVSRVQDTWWELFDLSGALGFSEPIPLNGARRPGDRDIYSLVFSTRPAWFPEETTLNLLFFDRETPRAERLDLSDMLQP